MDENGNQYDRMKNVKNKTLRNSGKKYTSQSKKLVPAKTPPTVVNKNVMNVVK